MSSWKSRLQVPFGVLALGLVSSAIFAASKPSAPAAAAAPEPPVVTKPIIGVLTAPAAGWSEISFVNVNRFPFDAKDGSVIKKPPLGPTSKTIFQSPEGQGTDLPTGQLIHLEYLPTFDSKVPKMGGKPHYHEFWEWGYTLKGDSIMPEPVSPYQANGMFYRKSQGGWLTRPPYSLHGGSWATGALRNQLPYDLIIFEEGDGHVINVGEPGQAGVYRGRDGKGPPPGTVGDWRQVKRFTRPWLLDSTRDVDWEDDKQVAGRFVKWLDDDMENGFRSQLVKIPPGWTPPKDYEKTYFENANRLRYMVWGSMKVWTFKNPQDAGKAYTVNEDHFIYQPPKAIWGYGPGPVTDEGAIFLEVTFAKGLKHGGGPIEDVKQAN